MTADNQTITSLLVCPKCQGKGVITTIDSDKLRRMRKAAGFTLRQMARRLYFSAAYISDIELGRRNCTENIAKVYKSLKPRKGKR